MIVSRTSYSATCPSPAVGKHTPVQPYSPVLHSVEESNANVPAKESSLHEDNSPMLDEPCVKVCVRKIEHASNDNISTVILKQNRNAIMDTLK